MIKVLRFVLFSLIIGVLFALYWKILVIPILGGTDYSYREYLQNKGCIELVLVGPTGLSAAVVGLLIYYKITKDKDLDNFFKIFVNKPVIIISILTLIFTILLLFHLIGLL